MAGKQISELEAATQINPEDLLLVQQGGVTKQIQRQLLGGFSQAHSVTSVNVTEHLDGSVAVVFVLDNGEQETMLLSVDSKGNPTSISYNGLSVPVRWTEVTE